MDKGPQIGCRMFKQEKRVGLQNSSVKNPIEGLLSSISERERVEVQVQQNHTLM